MIESLPPRQPHRVTSGFLTSSNLTQVEYNTKHAHYTNVIYKHNPKDSPFSTILLSGKKKRQINLDVDTIDRFDLAFQNQIFLKEKRMDKNKHKLKIVYKCIIPLPYI